MTRMTSLALIVLLGQTATGLSAEPDQVQTLINAVRGTDASARYTAISDLTGLGLDAAPAVPELTRALEDGDASIRDAAAWALAEIGPEAASAIPKLIEKLGETKDPWFVTDAPSPDPGWSAACALGKMGPQAVHPLKKCLAHADPKVRYLAAYALGEIGPEARDATPALKGLLADKEEAVRMQALWVLGQINRNVKAMTPVFLERLDDKVDGVRVAAVDALGEMRPVTPEVIEGLSRALRDKEGLVQAHAANSLGSLGDQAVPAVPALRDALNSRNGYPYPDGHPYFWRPVAEAAARALGHIGPAAKEAVPQLLETLRNTEGTFDEWGASVDNSEARAEAAKALARIAPDNHEVLLRLTRSLRDDHYIRGDMAVALGRLGEKAKDALPLLVELADDEGGDCRLESATATLCIQPGHHAAMRTLLAELETNASFEDETWDPIVAALAKNRSAARPAVPILMDIIKHEAFPGPARALSEFGPDAAEAVPVLIDMLSEDEDIRQEAVQALRQITRGDSPLLRSALKLREPQIRCGIVEVLGHFPSAVAQLAGALSDPSARVRLAAVRALATLGPAAAPAVPEIRKLLDDNSPTVQAAARAALAGLHLEDR